MKKLMFAVQMLVVWFTFISPLQAQRPQDNWYLENTLVKTGAVSSGGLSSPVSIAIGMNQKIYIADSGASRIQVYLPDGTFSFAITNNFGGTNSFSSPAGMTFDVSGNLYVADSGRNAVFKFAPDGAFLQKFGGVTGSQAGQLSGVIDVGVNINGDVFVLESGNCRVSVFSSAGLLLGNWGQSGLLDGQLYAPQSLAVSPAGLVYIAQCPVGDPSNGDSRETVKAFDQQGTYKNKFSFFEYRDVYGGGLRYGPVCVRLDASGLMYVVKAPLYGLGMAPNPDQSGGSDTDWYILQADGTELFETTISWGSYGENKQLKGQYHAVGPDGSFYLLHGTAKSISVFRRALRDQWAPPRNAIPMPAVVGINQRQNSPLVDIDYQVTDADDATVRTAVLIFTNGVQALSNCMRQITLEEGTTNNVGAGITANQPHRITWNAGADWGPVLGNYRVAILAKDSRQNLLDIHYLHLPAERGMPGLVISRCPLIESDFMQVWWWLLATQDTGINLSTGKVYGVGGAFDAKLLHNGTNTVADGRAYIYSKMNVRQATTNEVQWARAGPSGNYNQWSPTRSVGGRPMAVNEYGFDTGNWGTNAWWVVPLN